MSYKRHDLTDYPHFQQGDRYIVAMAGGEGEEGEWPILKHVAKDMQHAIDEDPFTDAPNIRTFSEGDWVDSLFVERNGEEIATWSRLKGWVERVVKPKARHPVQPLVLVNGVVRFKKNALVCFLLESGPYDMNKLALMPFSNEDREQFAQLIGYSLSGFGELSYVITETYRLAANQEVFEE